MGKKLTVLSILAILLISVACLPAAPKNTQKDADQDVAISDLKKSVDGLKESKASVADVNSLKATVDGIKSQPSTNTYTKAEVDAAISQAVNVAVNNLKNDQSWVKGTTPSGTPSGVSDTGKVAFTTTPVALSPIYSANTGGSQSIFYTMKIVNNTTTWQYVKPIITMSLVSTYTSKAVTGITVTMSSGGCSMTGSRTSSEPATSTITNFSVSPNVGSGATSTSSLTIIPISGCNGTGEFQIGSGQSMDILIQISNLTTNDVALWNVSNSISSRAL